MEIVQPTMPAGVILPFAGVNTPPGYLMCDGALVSRTAYATLFAMIGTTYGPGDGVNTFAVPDLRGMFLRGAGNNGKIAKANGGAYSGALGVYQGDAVQGHGHQMRTFENAGGALAGAYYGNNNSARNDMMNALMYDTGYGTPRIGDETRPASLGVNYLIKT